MEHLHNQERANIGLLHKFNMRDIVAFDSLYRMYYSELHFFACKLYRNTEIDASDVVQDIFVQIWQNKKIQFKEISKIKPYIYTAIRNGFLNYLEHNKTVVSKYNQHIIKNEDYFVVEIIESETFSAISEALDLLPKDCAEIFKAFIEGWDASEIADKLKCSKRTVYNKKNEAISILKQFLPNDKLLIVLSLF